MQGRRTGPTSGWWLGVAALLATLAACSSTAADTPPTAHQLFDRFADLVLVCAHATTAVARVPDGPVVSSTTGPTTATTKAAGSRATSPTAAYLPPANSPPPPRPAPIIDVPPPTPAITAPPGWQPPPTDPPGTIHASGRAPDLQPGGGRRHAAPGATGAPPEGWDT